MSNQRFLIIGDGIAGATAAEELRKQDEEADITVLTDDSVPLYNRIMLKNYMKGQLPKQYTQMHDEDWYEKKDTDLQLETRVVDVDRDRNEVETREGEKYVYDKLLIATGGSPRKLPQDEGFENLHYMWTLGDAEKVKESAENADRAVVVGGGLLGIDLAVAYAENDCEVYYLIRGENWWNRGLEPEGAEIIHSRLEEKGVNVMTEVEVSELRGSDDELEEIKLDSGSSIEDVDTVAVAIGQTPNSDFVELEKNNSGMIKTDKYLQTSDEDIFAAGNMVEYSSPVYGRRIYNGSWDHSEAMGKFAARNMLGEEEQFDFINTYGVGHFDVQFLSIGMTFGKPEVEKHERDQYRRMFYDDGKLVGAVLIGDVSGQEDIRKSIGP